MRTIVQLLLGLIVLSLPMIIAGTMVLALATSANLVPVLMPVAALLVAAAVGLAWMRWRRARRDGFAV